MTQSRIKLRGLGEGGSGELGPDSGDETDTGLRAREDGQGAISSFGPDNRSNPIFSGPVSTVGASLAFHIDRLGGRVVIREACIRTPELEKVRAAFMGRTVRGHDTGSSYGGRR